MLGSRADGRRVSYLVNRVHLVVHQDRTSAERVEQKQLFPGHCLYVEGGVPTRLPHSSLAYTNSGIGFALLISLMAVGSS